MTATATATPEPLPAMDTGPYSGGSAAAVDRRVQAPQRHRTSGPAVALAVAALLGGCATAPNDDAQPPAGGQSVDEPVSAEVGIPDLTPSAHWRTAIELLERGERELARAHMQRVIEARSWGKPRILLRELDVDPQRYLGAANFDYTVAPGDSLSLIAERFLGEKLKFYILARYNGITNPSLVSVGQRLRIPSRGRGAAAVAPASPDEDVLTPTAPPEVPAPAAPEVVPPAPPADGAARIEALLAGGRFEAAADAADASAGQPDTERLRERVYLTWARELQSNGQLDAAAAVLDRGAASVPGSTRLARRGATLNGLREADRYLREGLEAERVGGIDGMERALVLYDRGVSAAPNNVALVQRRDRVKAQLAEQWYRVGAERYRQQQLEEAIAAFDRVLALDPDNERAAARRDQAAEAADRLRDLSTPT